jgi:hypothetical protein
MLDEILKPPEEGALVAPPDKPPAPGVPRTPDAVKAYLDGPKSFHDVLEEAGVPLADWMKEGFRNMRPPGEPEVGDRTFGRSPADRRREFMRMVPLDLQHVALGDPRMREHVKGRPGMENPLDKAPRFVQAVRILFAGEERCGKTALAIAMARRRVDQMGCTAAYVSAWDLTGGDIALTYAREAELLVIDDLGEEDKRDNATVEVIVARRRRWKNRATWTITGLSKRALVAKYGQKVFRYFVDDAEVFLMGRPVTEEEKTR